MNHINTPFGFSTTRVGNVIIYACKLRINRVSDKIQKQLDALNEALPFVTFDFNPHNNHWLIQYSLTDVQKADYAQHSIGALLKAHAIDKLEAKYNWIDKSKCYVYSSDSDIDVDSQEASYQNIRELIEKFDFSTGTMAWFSALKLIKKMENDEDLPEVPFSMELALKICALRDAVVAHMEAYPYDKVKIYEDMYRAKITALHYGKIEYDDLILEMGVRIPYFFGTTINYLVGDGESPYSWERTIITDARRKMLHPEYGTFSDSFN